MRNPQDLKKSPTCSDKTADFTQSCQNKLEIFFKNFLTFSEKLNFTNWLGFVYFKPLGRAELSNF